MTKQQCDSKEPGTAAPLAEGSPFSAGHGDGKRQGDFEAQLSTKKSHGEVKLALRPHQRGWEKADGLEQHYRVQG